MRIENKHASNVTVEKTFVLYDIFMQIIVTVVVVIVVIISE